MKKVLSFVLAVSITTVSFASKSGKSKSSAPSVVVAIQQHVAASAELKELAQLPQSPSIEQRIASIKGNQANAEMTKAEKKAFKKQVKSEIKELKSELKSNELDVKWLILLLATVFLGFFVALWYYLQYGNEKPFKLILILSLLGIITFGITLFVAWVIGLVNFFTK